MWQAKGKLPAVAKVKLAKLDAARKRTAQKSAQYEKLRKAKVKQRVARESEKELVAQWRALRSLGVYSTKESPAAERLTKARRAAIKKKFGEVENLAHYENGEVFRPLHKITKPKTVVIRNPLGQTRKKYQRESISYKLDKDHFQFLRTKTKAKIPNSIKTAKGELIAKGANEKIVIDKKGKVKTVQTAGAAKTVFTREPLEGPLEFLLLADDIKSGRIKLRKGEWLALYSNGKKKTKMTINRDTLGLLAALIDRYAQPGYLRRSDGTPGDFDDWANHAYIIKTY